jgi:hypothetical protein
LEAILHLFLAVIAICVFNADFQLVDTMGKLRQ